jgi:hypothetical protein
VDERVGALSAENIGQSIFGSVRREIDVVVDGLPLGRRVLHLRGLLDVEAEDPPHAGRVLQQAD